MMEKLTMEKLTLSKRNLLKFIEGLGTQNRIYAPVKDDEVPAFKEIKNLSSVNLVFSNTYMPPKALLFPQTETLFKFIPGRKGEIEPIELDEKKTIIFGIRPCDAKSFDILDRVFKVDNEDPYFFARRNNSILIGLSCNKPCDNCFCTSFEDSPASAKNVDILLTDIGDKYYVEITTNKGKQLLKSLHKMLKPSKKSDHKKKKEIEKKATEMISRQQKTNDIAEKLDNLFESPLWDEVAAKCIGCGICTYLCPTCHCFDIQDESTLTKGARVRVWDTCMNPEYTLQASGYNPRPGRTNRVRNRIYHKYAYYPKNFDTIACVGCGRCIDMCPVNIDIIDVVAKAGGD